MRTFTVILITLCVVGICHAGYKMKRSPKPIPDDAKDTTKADSSPKKPSWKPVSEKQEFRVMVDDNIKHADQFRHETWSPDGSITGEYAAPARDGKWLKVQYKADKDGFHIINQQVVTEDELSRSSGGSAGANQASVETQVNGKDTKYTVKEEDLKKAAEANKKKSQQKPEDHSAL